MAIMNVKIEKDPQVLKYIPIVRKSTGKSISELKESLENADYILTCNGINIDELLEMKMLGLQSIYLRVIGKSALIFWIP
ncbi:hypothetical protein [Rossellomorea marisflavi]|uniref:hypothetical protein n=1 Tax=Rossellomorea marisflavi TaxID=189381 RepID=UPI00215C7541|nr:hypothetical protein [Rossellomorea marisflavi]